MSSVPPAPGSIKCPGCMRSVSDIARKCAYCMTDLSTIVRTSSIAPGKIDERPAVRCALCSLMYSAERYPNGCPHCQNEFSDPIRNAEVGERRRFMLRTLGFRCGVGALSFVMGGFAGRLLAGSVQTFGSFFKAAMIAGGLLAAIIAWRAYDAAELRDEPAWLVALVTLIAAAAGLGPWCNVTALWANGYGLTSPVVVVRCVVTAAEPRGKDLADYGLDCTLDDGRQLHGHGSGPRGILVSERVALRVRKGRLGYFVADADVEAFTVPND